MPHTLNRAAMENGENSSSKLAEDEVWAKLIPTESCYSEIELSLKETIICSEVKSSSGKQEWCKITRNVDLDSATMQNKSSREILVDETVVQDAHVAVIKCGSEISLGPSDEGFVKYRFEMMPTEESRRFIKVSFDVEHAKCCICLNIWHDVVTAAPCLHSFCNGCFSECLKKSRERKCPRCRAVVQFVGRNHFLHNIEEDILLANPSLKRSREDILQLNSMATIKSPLVLSNKRSRRKRERYPSDEENSWEHSSLYSSDDENSWEHSCPQCGTEFGGFQCTESTVHLQCQACGGMMPSRLNSGVQQHCLGCDRAFCAAYWNHMGVTGSNSLCTPETFKPIGERTISRIPSLAHEKNQYEQNITERCIREMGKSLQDVLADWILKFDNREIDRTRMPLNHAEMITSRTFTCRDCYDKLVSFLLYWFRVTMTADLLPPQVAQRQDCWYGYACRTQHHNQEHARKSNHVCRPTRGRHT